MANRREKSFSPNVNLWLDVKSDIEIKIITGEYAAGDRIPPIVKIAEIYKVGNTTAQKVLESLYSDGTITKQKGVGYFVKPFVRDRLLKTHEVELKKRLIEDISYGIRVGFDKIKILSITQEALNELMGV